MRCQPSDTVPTAAQQWGPSLKSALSSRISGHAARKTKIIHKIYPPVVVFFVKNRATDPPKVVISPEYRCRSTDYAFRISLSTLLIKKAMSKQTSDKTHAAHTAIRNVAHERDLHAQQLRGKHLL